MHVAVLLVSLAAVVVAVDWVCRRIGWPTELTLVVVGAAVEFVPWVPTVNLDPEIVLTGLLPPLLWSATLRLSLFDLRRNVAPVLQLSVGAVVFTTFAVGGVTMAVLPGATWAAALALGAVVAPPDAVAATSIGKRIGMPRRITNMLEDESLLNDATALALLTATTAAISEAVSPGRIAGTFLLAAGGGIGFGLAVGFVLARIRRHLTEPALDTTLSLAAPFVAYLPAEAVGASGVLSVVVAGVMLARKSTVLQDATGRIVERTTWKTVGFLLENSVFLLIGTQLPPLLARVVDQRDTPGGTPLWLALVVCVVVLVATVLARIVFSAGIFLGYQLLPARRHRENWRAGNSVVLGWAGMRGVVTLAAAYVLPADTPHVDVLRLAAFTVVAGTLGAQGLTLPALVRRLGLRGPDPAEDALQFATVLDDSTAAGNRRLDELLTGDEPTEVVDALRHRGTVRTNSAWERLGGADSDAETPSATYRRLRIAMLNAERDRVVALRGGGQWDDEVLQRALADVDREESLLDRSDRADAEVDRAEELVAAGARDCEHLADAPHVIRLDTPGRCSECERDGTAWVHLRGCLTCGHVACCDSSTARHATRHHHETGHPVMRSVEPGEAWRWCYVDSQLG